ncbi:AraC family transcriptional regulator [Aporhodopirellula aestuarii]|uniref:DNA-binding transcriptional regulator n=1 Tax=Aporhodopirellula aestuarii TaxID=2950107 RepID=A0ABT0UC82_9BACT|nr:DNA-binding transcriptional regulator [Aporhodopirellula aestuarii]MCM2374461.1 DNA-binding transcriptional regulator [Aporhodopirellula aestuarii]
MKPKSRPRIALLVEASRAYGRELLRGVALFARTQVDWSLLHQEMTLDSAFPDWISSARVSGVIARVDLHTIDPLRKLNVPIVDVRCNRKFDGIPQVETDNKKVAELAFEHLWDRGFRRFAFCGFRFASYSDARLRYFRELVAASGCTLSVYESKGKPSSSLTMLEEAGLVDFEPLSKWLATLQRPTGLFVCNDIRGQQVLNACRNIEASVPDDIGVIGVDDDDAICLLCDPTLSSVRPDAVRVGYRAGEILHQMLSGLQPEEQIEYISPTSVCERFSTKVIAVDDVELARVCRFIRQHACDGINVGDVAEFTTLSRRQLERRCQEELDQTLHQLITATQIARVKQLLTETKMTLEQITHRTGYSHKERLSAVFKRETGQTPGEYRSQNAKPPAP